MRANGGDQAKVPSHSTGGCPVGFALKIDLVNGASLRGCTLRLIILWRRLAAAGSDPRESECSDGMGLGHFACGTERAIANQQFLSDSVLALHI